jgi:hypothetical protein
LTALPALEDFNAIGTVEASHQLGMLDHELSTTIGGSFVDVVLPEALPSPPPLVVVFALFGSLWRLPGGEITEHEQHTKQK